VTGRLQGRTALVTGSTSGIGVAIARALATEGAHVVVTGRNEERGAKTVAEIEAAGGRADFVAADLGSGAEAVTALATRTTELVGGAPDILVNNAAFLVGGTTTAGTEDATVDAALAVSVAAPFLLTRALAPAMAARGSGAIVNIGSINGMVGMNGAALYGATKAALHSLTKSWAAEFGPAGVRVNTVAPGPTLTEGNEQRRDMLAGLVAGIPSRRLSTVEEVAAAVVFLAGNDAGNIHGATLPVDGGFTTV
jgi:NAD(P)-dependent dehydrogenase (short-subunit alcohol dehydrogenase family)